MTEKLYYSDSHMTTFSATVKKCQQVGEHYEVVLDRTAFFPTGGGQDADTGVLGNANVVDVKEREDIVYHMVDEPLEVGSMVEGTIDWEERLSKMQQHSGEHIVSGIIHDMFGYDNVGFHMGTDAITMDFDGLIVPSQLCEIEYKANQVVAKNVDIIGFYPTKEELQEIEYRSKKDIEGQVRLVEIVGCDRCACCAPHVKKTGEIGIIKLTNVQNYKGGVRISMLCGFRALEDFNKKAASIKQLCVMFSAKEHEVVGEVERLHGELSEKKNVIWNLQKELLQCKVNALHEITPCMIMFEETLEGNGIRELMNLLLDRGAEVAAVFAGTEEDGYRYVIGSKSKDVRPYAKIICEKFAGRGGGKPEMVQGSLKGKESEIREEIMTCG